MNKKSITARWVDLGEFGQHKATVVAYLGEFPYVDEVEITFKGETLNLVKLIPPELEAEIITDLEVAEAEYLRDQRTDSAIDAALFDATEARAINSGNGVI